MHITNKALLVIISFSLLLTAIGIIAILTNNYSLDIVLTAGAGLFVISGTYLLTKNGSFISSPEYRKMKSGIALILIGVMFKIMHWPFSGVILLLGFISFPAAYLYYLIKNHKISLISLLKLSFIITIFLSRFLKIMHLPYSEEIALIAIFILLILLIDFIKNKQITEKSS